MTRPNVVIILADDLGYSDLGCFGGEIPTPNIDSLADDGIRMTDFTVTPRCSPSRAALLTGRYPHETGIGILVSDDRPNGYPGSMDPSIGTIATRLGEAGYATCAVGKWHVAADQHEENESWPQNRGFDESYVIMGGAASYFQPKNLRRDGIRVDHETADPDFYFTDAIGGEASRFVQRSVEAEEPFFLYMAVTAPHWPLHARQEDIDSVRGNYDAGWDASREARLQRLVDRGVFPAGTALSPRDPNVSPWEATPEHDWQASRMEVYAAQVVALDRAVGAVTESLRRAGALEDTLILILSDNGACAETTPEIDVNTFKNEITCPRTTREGDPVRVGNDPTITPGAESTFSSYGPEWANVSNTPFRLYKRWVHEGGIASPLVAHWPSRFGAAGGSLRRGAGNVIDILPTVLDAAGVPSDANDRGVSLLPHLSGSELHREESVLAWEHVGNAAIRDGRWKLVREAEGPWELYDLEVDRTELHDLSEAEPDVVETLARRWQLWADTHNVLPWSSVVSDYAQRGAMHQLTATI